MQMEDHPGTSIDFLTSGQEGCIRWIYKWRILNYLYHNILFNSSQEWRATYKIKYLNADNSILIVSLYI